MKCPLCRFENPEGARICINCDTPLPRAEKAAAVEGEAETKKEALTELTPGRTFANRYQVLEEVGHGELGRVYKVLDYKTGEQIALKLISPEIASDPSTMERFQSELRLARKIRHKNVCGMHDIGEFEGTHFVTMDYVMGQELETMIRMIGTLSISTVLSIGKQVCEGLAEAHSLGVIHRDLNSRNILIDKSGTAKIMDFGLARSTKDVGRTGLNILIGTPEYMSPEQAEAQEIDYRSDIYALGVILYEMATGRVPYEGDTALAVSIKHKGPIPKNPKKFNPNIPEALSNVILKCLEKDKARRYQNAIEIREELEKVEKAPPAVAPIEPQRKPVAARKAAAKLDLKKLGIPALIGAALVIAAVIIIPGSVHRKPAAVTARSQKRSVAVLPFDDVSSAKDCEFLARGIPETLIHKLSNIRDLRIPTGTSSFALEGKSMDVSQIGVELGADNLVQGSVQVSGDRLRMTVRLLNVQTGRPIWSDKYDRRMGDIFAVQDEIAQKIARALKVKVSDEEKNAIVEKSTEDVKAYTLFLQGRLSLSKRGEEDLKKAIALFESAVREDPMYSLACAGIAESYFDLASRGLVPSNQCYPKALESASQAVLLDETLADAHAWLGAVKFYFEYNLVSAEMELLRAIELNPAYAPAHSFLAFILISTGRRDQAISEMELARDLDPLSARINANVGLMYINARRYDQAIDILNKTTEKFPEEQNAAKYLGAAYFFKSMYEQAAEIFQKAGCRSDLGITYIKMERTTEAQKIIKELVEESKKELISSYEVAKLYFSTGEVDQGFNWLNRAYAERGPSIYMMKVDPFLDSIRSDPRYHELLKRMNLE